tara:strand:+ start:478 stop:885 length:408 start_codon:yes stop_codon:yes gene_type:complete
MTTDLWTPQGVTGHTVSPVGFNAETGGGIQQHVFQVHDPVTGKRHKFCVLADNSTSQAHLEDMVASAVGRWLAEVRQKDHRPAPTPEQRKEIGKILDEIRISRLKKSQNSKVHYLGLKGASNGRHRGTNNGKGHL